MYVFKCMSFLGHIDFSDGTKVDIQNIEVVQSWPKTTSLSNIRSIFDLVFYFIRFVEGFSSISSDLTKLT